MSRLRTACLSLAAMAVISLVLISILSQDIQGIEDKYGGKQRRKRSDESGGESKAVTTKKPRKPLEDQIVIGPKRFQLYDNDKMSYKEAGTFCKKEGGKLAQAANMDEMRGLQILLMKSQVLGRDIWIGADKKEWKQHAFKMQRKPMFGPDPALFGGGPTEMCPALSFSTRSLFPVSCNTDLPLICEFDKNHKPKKSNQKATTRKPKPRTHQPPIVITVRPKRSHVEMRRKRDVESTTDRDGVPSTENNENLKFSSTTDGSAIEVFDEEEVAEEVTPGPEKSREEHSIGFKPHIEHEMRSGHQFQAKLSASLQVQTIDDNEISSTMDPDQFMVNLIDEQTTNLTAIELESQEHKESTPQPRFAMLADSVDEIIGNELDSRMSENATADGFAFEEFMDSGFYNTSDIPSSESLRVKTNASAEADDVGLVSSTVAAMTEEVSDGKRQARNVTAPMAQMNGTMSHNGSLVDFGAQNENSATTQMTSDTKDSIRFESTEGALGESSSTAVDDATISPDESLSSSSTASIFGENEPNDSTYKSA